MEPPDKIGARCLIFRAFLYNIDNLRRGKKMSSQNDKLHAMRHSLAHIMAAAIQKTHPEAKFGVGPVVENGFYYDVLTKKPLGEQDLMAIESEMHAIVGHKLEFERSDWPIDQAISYFKEHKQDFKVELLGDLKSKGTTSLKDIAAEDVGATKSADKVSSVSIYQTGDFTDLCRGPHLKNTSQAGFFKLTKLAGAYWRGDEKNPQMQRVYGVAFATEKELKDYFWQLEEAQKRDHRKLGRELDLFVFSDLVGAGLPLWTPKGTVLRRALDNFVQELRSEYDYQAVTIPHITKKDLYQKSGHWSKFKDELFRIETREGHEFAIKPMNCPHHTQIYASRPRSYRELPIRYSETTMVYRDEQSGELHGLERIRGGITQDDAHVFCRASQIEQEISQIWAIIEKFYKTFGIELAVRLSTKGDEEGYLGDAKLWREAEDTLKKIARQKCGEDYIDGPGEAAFYGPKLDFIGTDSLGRQLQVGTIQLDFNQPQSFELACVNEKGSHERVVMIHCAIAGSLERCLALLIEHFAGAFPVWLAPVQVAVVSVSDKFEEYAAGVAAKLKTAGVRVELSDGGESLGKRIRTAELAKIPYTLVVGEKEVKSKTVAVRQLSQGDKGVVELDKFTRRLLEEIRNRSL